MQFIFVLMKGNYNIIAPYYDRLSKLIYGNAIVNAQQYVVNFIIPGSAFLIVGGGTGWILEEISKRHTNGLAITYVEISEKMMELSRRRNIANNHVDFTTGPIQDVLLDGRYDAVITPFLLDNFSPVTTMAVFKKIHSVLRPSGYWFFCDFQLSRKHRLWQKPLLKLMYLFFRSVCNIEANSLPDTASMFDKYGYKEIAYKNFFHRFIQSVVYQKQIN